MNKNEILIIINVSELEVKSTKVERLLNNDFAFKNDISEIIQLFTIIASKKNFKCNFCNLYVTHFVI